MGRSNRLWIAVVGMALLGPSSAVMSQDTEQTIVGEILDPASYLKEGVYGADHIDVTYEAVDGGQSLALLEVSSGKIYILLADEPGEDPNELVYDYVGQRVKVTGTVYQRGDLSGIVAASIEPIVAEQDGDVPAEMQDD